MVEYLSVLLSAIGAPVGIASASLTLIFSLTTGIKKHFRHNKKQKEKAW